MKGGKTGSMKPRRFCHLTMHKRLKIEQMNREKYTIQEIAKAVGVHYTTVWRELKRGQVVQRTTELIDREVYCADVAERKYRENLAAKGPELKIANDRELADYLENLMLKDRYSPAAVLAKIKEEGRVFSVEISEWTLYSYITKGVFRTLTNKDLPMRGEKKRKHRKVQPARAPAGDSIEERDPAVEMRECFGDWEMDLIVGKGQKGAILTLCERSVNYMMMGRLPQGKKPEAVAEAVIRMLMPFKEHVLTITTDNGGEFRCHRKSAERLATTVYFADSYASWQKGAIEKTNKLIRQYIPKGTDFRLLTDEFIRNVQYKINRRPREKLNFYTPKECFFKLFA